MGIRLNAVHLLSRYLSTVDRLDEKRLLTVGVQDCYFTYDQVVKFLVRHRIRHYPVPARERLPTTGFKWASAQDVSRYREFIHQATLFRLLGFAPGNISSLDVSEYEGADIVHDLNLPVADSLHSTFDLIFDGGTTEHVFSLKDALFNYARMCKVGGVVINHSPTDFINHGFVNLCAEIFRDFYSANGFEELEAKYVLTPNHPGRVEEHYLEYEPKELHFSLNPYYAAGVWSVFKKLREVPLRVPVQGFYRQLLANGSGGRESGTDSAPERTRLWRGAVDLVDRFFLPSVLVRGYRSIGKGKRVEL